MTKILMAVVALAFVAASCGKYEEGPKISFASKEARIINIWSLDAQFENGVEQTLTAEDKDDYIEFMKDGKAVISWVYGGTTTDIDATWELSDDKEQLIMYMTYEMMGTTYTDTTESTILRLKSNEMWLEQVDGSDKTEMHYITKE
ncbi:hypothetical protein DSECCO2_582030 [anaerobic digester metagenome]